MKNPSNPTAMLTHCFNEIVSWLDNVLLTASNAERAERGQVYYHIAAFVGDTYERSLAASLAVVHHLAGERDPSLLGKTDVSVDADLLAKTTTNVRHIRVYYVFGENRQIHRTTAVTFRDIPARTITECHRWDDLPRSIRAANMIEDAKEIVFQIYPRVSSAEPSKVPA